MYNVIKENLVGILLCAAFFVFGTVVGVSTNPNKNGIYLSLSWSGEEVFSLGRNELSVSSLDLENISDVDSKTLIIKLEKLTPDNVFSKDLIELRDKTKGPFAPIDLKINVRFVDTEKFSSTLAMACPKSAIYGRKILLHNIVSPRSEIIVDASRIQEFDVVVAQNVSECFEGEDSKYTVWINKTMIKEWLNLNDVDLSSVSVGARIMNIILFGG